MIINPNRTKAESETTFRMHECRRQAAACRSARADANQRVAVRSSVVAVGPSPAPPAVPPSAHSSDAGDVIAPTAGASSSSAAPAAAPSASSLMDVAASSSGPIGVSSDVALRTQRFLSDLYHAVSTGTQDPVVNTATSDGRPA